MFKTKVCYATSVKIKLFELIANTLYFLAIFITFKNNLVPMEILIKKILVSVNDI